MTKSIYVSALESGSGKSLVTLGIMELLSHRVERLGFFRPVVRGIGDRDNDIELMRLQYGLSQSYESSYAATHQEARELVTNGQQDELLKRVLVQFKQLERQCDFVVCEGTDDSGLSSAFEFDFNAEVASHLGSTVVVVLNGKKSSQDLLVAAIASAREELARFNCNVAATIVNRAPPERLEMTRILREHAHLDDSIFLIPETAALNLPTVWEISDALGAQVIYGDKDNLNRETLNYKIAAMELPHFLEYVQDGSLIITPGDRADIILGSLATTLSSCHARISGIVLTGGLGLAPQIKRLIDGIQQPAVAILSVEGDTFSVATQINSISATLTPRNPRKIATALGAFEANVDTERLGRLIAVSRATCITPLMFEYELVERAKGRPQHIVLAEGEEDRILRAADILLRREVVTITLLGAEDHIRARALALGVDLRQAAIIDPACSSWRDAFGKVYYELREHKGITPDAAADTILDTNYFGTMMVRQGMADGMVSGATHTTAHTIRPAFEIIKTREGCSIISSVLFMCLSDRVLVYADCAVNPNPNARQLADIAVTSAGTAQAFGIEPLVAMLSYSTGQSGTGKDVDKVREATQLVRNARPDLLIEGPIQYDAAIDAGVARTKIPGSKVAGQATVFIFPDLNTGNITHKAVQRSSGGVVIGPVLQGLKMPVNDLSRGCTVTDIVNTVAITAIQAQMGAVGNLRAAMSAAPTSSRG